MVLQATVQRRACQVRDRRLQGIETVIQRQQRVLAKCDDDCLASTDRTVDRGSFGPVGRSTAEDRSFHFATVLGLIPWNAPSNPGDQTPSDEYYGCQICQDLKYYGVMILRS